jgi:hypothetical protein
MYDYIQLLSVKWRQRVGAEQKLKRVVRYDGSEKGQRLSDESKVEESVKIQRFKMRDIKKKETVLSNLRLRGLKRRFVCKVKI